jgi:uncharacterized damage-inducible protein DinB
MAQLCNTGQTNGGMLFARRAAARPLAGIVFEVKLDFEACLNQEKPVTELEQLLSGDGAAAAPAHILEGLTQEIVHRVPQGAPHSIYEELWHIAFWQQVSLDWIGGIETPFPASARDGFPTVLDAEREYWEQLCARFFAGNAQASGVAGDSAGLETQVRCPSRPGQPLRVMTVREQLGSVATHNAYHFGRIVLLRQLLGVWPPRSGGYTW